MLLTAQKLKRSAICGSRKNAAREEVKTMRVEERKSRIDTIQ